MSRRRAVILLLLTIYVLFILDLTWFQFPSRDPTVNLLPFRTIVADCTTGGRDFVVNFLGNIAAFVPIGMVPRVARPRHAGVGRAALFSLGLSLLIEGVQYATGRRYADVDDLILNTSGGVLGHCILSLFLALRREPAAFERERPAGEGTPPPDGP